MNILFAFYISMCDKSRNTWLCVHWQWNTLEWCQLNALQASPVVHLVTPLLCVSLSMNTQPSVPAIETFSALLAICGGNSPFTGEFPAQRPVMRSFDVFFDLRPNKRMSKQSWGWWFETSSRPLWRRPWWHRQYIQCVLIITSRD